MVALVGYFDESGHPRDPRTPYFGIGGVIGAADDWAELDERWRKMLADEGFQAIHMTDLLRRKRAFSNKKVWTEEKQKDLIGRCVSMVSECLKPRLFGGYFVVFQPRQGRIPTETMYLGCFGKILKKLAGQFRPDGDPIHLVLADHPEVTETRLAGYFGLWRKRNPRLGSFTIDTPDRLRPLQVADVVAYVQGSEFARDKGLAFIYDVLFPKELSSQLDLLEEGC